MSELKAKPCPLCGAKMEGSENDPVRHWRRHPSQFGTTCPFSGMYLNKRGLPQWNAAPRKDDPIKLSPGVTIMWCDESAEVGENWRQALSRQVGRTSWYASWFLDLSVPYHEYMTNDEIDAAVAAYYTAITPKPKRKRKVVQFHVLRSGTAWRTPVLAQDKLTAWTVSYEKRSGEKMTMPTAIVNNAWWFLGESHTRYHAIIYRPGLGSFGSYAQADMKRLKLKAKYPDQRFTIVRLQWEIEE